MKKPELVFEFTNYNVKAPKDAKIVKMPDEFWDDYLKGELNDYKFSYSSKGIYYYKTAKDNSTEKEKIEEWLKKIFKDKEIWEVEWKFKYLWPEYVAWIQ